MTQAQIKFLKAMLDKAADRKRRGLYAEPAPKMPAEVRRAKLICQRWSAKNRQSTERRHARLDAEKTDVLAEIMFGTDLQARAALKRFMALKV